MALKFRQRSGGIGSRRISQQQKQGQKHLLQLVVCVLVAVLLGRNLLEGREALASQELADFLEITSGSSSLSITTKCAIHFYGLPRAFDALVLPTIDVNIISQNPNCDYFVQYYDAAVEAKGRSGQGGALNPQEIFHLGDRIHQRHPSAFVTFNSTTEQEFQQMNAEAIHKVSNLKDERGKPAYFPWAETSYVNPDTTINVLKMWHGMRTTWKMMEEYERQNPNVQYDRVAILRNDVVYMTPLDVYELVPCTGPNCVHELNKTAYIPGFSMGPVSDRSFVGPYRAAKIWALGRFDKMDENVATMKKVDRGFGMHSEKFVLHTVFPQINGTTDVTIYEHPLMCFLRARVDLTIWHYDCNGPERWFKKSIITNLAGVSGVREKIEAMTNRTCRDVEHRIPSGRTVRKQPALDCSGRPEVPNERKPRQKRLPAHVPRK